MRLKSSWSVVLPHFIRFFKFWGRNVGSGKPLETPLDGDVELVDLLAYAVKCGAGGGDEIPILTNDQIYFRTISEGWRERFACAKTLRVRGINNGPEITIPLFECIDKVKVTSFGHAKLMEEFAVLRITHEGKRPDADNFSGAMLAN